MASTNPKSSGSGYSAEMDEAERASRDEMTALQTRRLAWTLAHAYDNVAHYKKAFDAAGVHPSDFRQLSDLAKFPFTVKTDLRDNYPFAMYAESMRHGLAPRKSSLKIGIFGDEPWTNAMRAESEQTFDMDATDSYGLTEVIGPGVAQECIETKDGLHIWEDHFYPEVIDPETGAVLPDGERGELVFTSLTKQAFPIIRYRTRDLTRLLPGTARPCIRRRRTGT